MSKDATSEDLGEPRGGSYDSGHYLIEEGAPWFTSLLETAIENNDVKSESDKVAIYLHAFMLELGFINSVGPDEISKLPQNWKSPSGYVTKYRFLPISDASIVLNVISLGKLLKVHGTNMSTKETFSSAAIKSSQFFRKSDGNLSNVGRLARLFKNEVGSRLLNSARLEHGYQISGLSGLAPELLIKIFSKLDLKSLLSISNVNKQFLIFYKENVIWRKLFLTDFGSRCFEKACSINGSDPDWYHLYKTEYSKRKLQNNIREELEPRRPPMFPFPDFSTDPGAPEMPGIPGMIGGEYDRFPGGGLGGLGPGFGRLPAPRFDPPGPNFPQFGPRRGVGRGRGGFGGPPGFGGGGFGGFM